MTSLQRLSDNGVLSSYIVCDKIDLACSQIYIMNFSFSQRSQKIYDLFWRDLNCTIPMLIEFSESMKHARTSQFE